MANRFGAEADDLARQRRMMTTPASWPQWPFLPVIRRGDCGLQLGVLFDARTVCGLTGYSTTVFLTCLFVLPRTVAEFLRLPREVFDTTDELLARGWRID